MQIEQEQDVSFVEAARILNAQIRGAATESERQREVGGSTTRNTTVTVNIAGNADDPEAVGREVEEAVDRALGRAALFDEQMRGS